MKRVRIPVTYTSELEPDVVRLVPIRSILNPDETCQPSRVGECALVLHKNRIYAVGSVCPHQNAPFTGAKIEKGKIVCPRHSYCFNLKSGECATIGGYGIPTFPVEVENGIVYVQVWEDS